MADQELIVKIGARIDGLVNALRASEERIRAFGKTAQDIGKTLTKNVTAPIAAIGTAAFAASVRLGNFADTLLDLEQQTGLSTESLQQYRLVSIQAGVATDVVAKAAETLQKRFAQGEEGSKELALGLQSIGVNSRDASGNLLSMDAILEDTIKQLSGIQNVTERNQLAFKIFGDSATALIPVLSLSSKEIENAKNKAGELGLVLSKDALQGANEFRIQFDTLKATLSGVTNEIGSAFLPVAEKLVSILQDNIVPAVRDIVEFLGNLSTTTKTTITVILGLTAAIGPLLFGIGALTKAIPFLLAGLNALKLGAVLLSTPVGLAVAAITSLVLAFNFAERASQQYKNINEKVSQSQQQVEGATKKLAETQKFLNGLLGNYNLLSEEEKKNAQEQLTIRLNTAKSLLQLAKASRAAAIEEAIRITVFDRIKQAVGLTSGVFDRLQSIISETSGGINGLESDINALETSFGLLGQAVAEAGSQTQTTLEKFSAIADIRNEEVFARWTQEADAYNNTIKETIDLQNRIANLSQNIALTFEPIEDFGDLTEGLGAPVKEFADEIASTFEKVKLNINDLQGAFTGLGSLIGSTLNNLPLGSFLGQFASFVAQVVAGAFAVAKANAIAGATKSSLFTGPAAAFTLPAFIATSVGLVASAFAGLKGAGNRGSVGGGGIATSGVGSGVGSTFGGGTGGAFDFNRQIELVGEFSVSGDQLKYVIQNSNNFEN